MTSTTNTFGALAFTILTVFALWSSTLSMPAQQAPVPAHATVSAAV